MWQSRRIKQNYLLQADQSDLFLQVWVNILKFTVHESKVKLKTIILNTIFTWHRSDDEAGAGASVLANIGVEWRCVI